MSIDNKNLDKNATFVRIPVVLNVHTVAASQSDIEQASFRAPYAGKIVSIHAHVVGLTDADDSARWDVKKATTSVLTATVDPVAAGTTSAGTLKTDGTATFAAGDKLGVFVTTAGSDLVTQLSVTIVIRPLIGSDETGRPTA
jgi:hypothetical protein